MFCTSIYMILRDHHHFSKENTQKGNNMNGNLRTRFQFITNFKIQISKSF